MSTVVTSAVFIALSLTSTSVLAMPRFAVQQAAACSLCHQNPTGGGGRTAYGSGLYSRLRLPLGTSEVTEEAAPALLPEVSPGISVGFDLRFGRVHTMPRAVVPEERQIPSSRSMVMMQGDLYVMAKLNRMLSLYFDQGINGSNELFAAIGPGWWQLKAGRFLPAFGWRFPDHTLFVRESLGFGPREKDTGVSAVIDTPSFTVEVGAFNGAGAEAFLDVDGHTAFSARAEARGRLGTGARGSIGLSGYQNDEAFGDKVSTDRRFGVFGGAAIGRLSYLFELDVGEKTRDEALETGGSVRVTERGLFAMNELALVLMRGVQLAATWEHWDPNDEISGDLTQRLGVGVNLFPTAFFELELAVKQTLADPKNPRSNLVDMVVLLHAFF